MILTLAWKEYREHRSIWITMVLVTAGLTLLMAEVIAPRDSFIARAAIPALMVLGMAATYGVVCGSMMFAGEREGGTMTFLDIFLGRRGVLWFWKLALGVALVITEALAVAALLHLLNLAPPSWLPALVGRSTGEGVGLIGLPFGGRALNVPQAWFLVLPTITVEALAWGLLGSSMTRRVLSGAALAAAMASPVWLLAVCAPPPISLGVRLVAAASALFVSCNLFLSQSRDLAPGPAPRPEELSRPRPRARKRKDYFDLDMLGLLPSRSAPAQASADEVPAVGSRSRERLPRLQPPPRRKPLVLPAGSPAEALMWLCFRQARSVFLGLAVAGLVFGVLLPANAQVVWPLATLLLGVACGIAAFAQEQSDLSYQQLGAQHLPLKTFWNAKIIFWFTVALTAALWMALAGTLTFLMRSLVGAFPRAGGAAAAAPGGFEFGTLRELLGPVLFFGVWLVYGFAAGQLFVLLCRKVILAVLLAGVVAASALGLWLPALLCRGLNGWQVWLTPVAALLATRLLMRAWVGGRIKERRPVYALVGLATALVVWYALFAGLRTWELPDLGEPMDRAAFRASIPSNKANLGGQKIQDALVDAEKEVLDRRDNQDLGHPVLAPLAEAARLPLGVIEVPSGDGQLPVLRHLPSARTLARKLRLWSSAARAEGRNGPAFDCLSHMLLLSRTLRNKASVESYLVGVEIEELALKDLGAWLSDKKMSADMLDKLLAELNRHAAQTPPPVDCLHTECFRAGGAVKNPTVWTFFSGQGAGRVSERMLAGAIAMSLDAPWEDEHKTRLWRAVWPGLLRGLETPHWQLPRRAEAVAATNETTRKILEGWVPAADGPESSVTVARLARLLDESWLADERLFTPVVPVRNAATRGNWRTHATRLATALTLYQTREKKTAEKLADLVPNYLPELPLDPYSGESFRYRISGGEDLDMPDQHARVHVQAGQGILWSTGPDGADDGGRQHGGHLADTEPHWLGPGLDLLTIVPSRP